MNKLPILRLKCSLILSFFLLLPFVVTQSARANDELMEAALFGHIRTLTFLLDHGADVNFQDKRYGASALQAASQTGEEKIVRLLLKRGANVNLQDKEGSTALMAAAYNGRDEIIKILLAAGAEVNYKSPADETALSLAREERQEDIIQLLQEAGAKDIPKRCPNPNVRYKTWPVREYWKWFVTGHVTEWIESGKHLCAKYSFQFEDNRENAAVLFSLKKLENREAKEAGIRQGIQLVFEMNEVGFKSLKDEEKLDRFNKIFSSRYTPRLEAVTGLKFDSPGQWFEWIKANKDRLVLSEDGKYVGVR